MSQARVWRLPEVIKQTGLSRSTIYEKIGNGEFPRQFNLGPRSVGWLSDDVLGWIDSRSKESIGGGETESQSSVNRRAHCSES